MADIQTQRVQSIASLSLRNGTIPTQFVRLEHEQPGMTTCHGPLLEVPVLNIAEQDEEKLVQSVYEASREWGFFQITGHGIPDDVIAKLQKVGREFFESPPEEKEKYAKVPGSCSLEGYGTMLQKEMKGKIGWVDHLFHKIWPPSSINYKFWPRNPSTYREVNEEYAKCLHGVARGENKAHDLGVADKLLKTLSLGLGLDNDELKVAVGGDELEYLLKINYYPPCPRPDLALGVVAHTDMSVMTILVPNEIQGLQLFRDDHWYDVQYVPGALIVHIGDQLEIVSNGEYKAVLHRTKVNKENTRMSWPVFLDPPSELEVGPHPKLVTDENPAKFKTKKYQDYVHCKLNKIPQ